MSLEAFEYIDFILVFFIIILSVLLIKSIFFRKHLHFVNWFSVFSISIICVIVSSVLLYFIGYAADEVPNFTGAQYYIYKYIAIVFLSVVNSVIAVWKRI
ncbi:hypothetical protein F7731_18420 [Cytobacillus depressus]|uniref:Uncharacterized protein n=1 Tax=Cytobacillus depressus TaxID=1602942 RepID=A0A6L3V1E0_9BACI|nr:hypothetical protein [Cytobacillus depressus]KAB2331557.1 hypothetical protein F7731_18420 [Cytobacillus depressus]